jgi:hypothetical protein
MMTLRKTALIAVAGAVAAVFALMWTGHALFADPTPAASAARPATANERARTEQLLAYNDSIRLTAEQEAVRREALEALPAPCCARFTAATCCCECNMARATWGLAKHLIADEGYDAERVRKEVAAWHAEINPGGFTGEACFNGGCGRAFADDGCGGMDRRKLVH